MNRQVYAEIVFSLPAEKRPRGPFLVQAKLPGDGDANPYGQWSLAVRPITEYESGRAPDSMPAFVAFVAEEAPHELLTADIELYRGVTRIARAHVAPRVEDVAPDDADFLLFEHEAA